MKITGIQQYCYTFEGSHQHYIKVDTDEGIYGIGEATLRAKVPMVMEAVKLLEPHLLGMSVYDIEYWFYKLFTNDRWRNGVAMNSAISGIEMALWDAMGKKLEVPVYNLLGGRVRDKIQLYANGWSGVKELGENVGDRARHVVGQGFRALKWDPLPWPSFDSCEREIVTKEILASAVESVASVREAVGPDTELFIEAHGRLDFDQSLQLVRELEPYNPGFIEEPMHPDDWEGFRKLALKSNIPIATGERLFTRWGHKRLYEEGAVSIVQPDFTHCGGILEGKKMSAMAEAYYMKVAPHNSSGPVATMAAVHVDATIPNFFMQEYIYMKNLKLNTLLFKKGMTIEDGCVILDDSPGLGLVPDLDEMEKGKYIYDSSINHP